MSWRRKLFEEMQFNIAVPFDTGDSGPSGGIQVIEPASVRISPYYTPDRVLRFTGDTSPKDPWPSVMCEDPSLTETSKAAKLGIERQASCQA